MVNRVAGWEQGKGTERIGPVGVLGHYRDRGDNSLRREGRRTVRQTDQKEVHMADWLVGDRSIPQEELVAVGTLNRVAEGSPPNEVGTTTID